MDIRNAEAVYPLSFVQESLLSQSNQDQDGVSQSRVALQGPLNFAAFAQAWQQACSHHSILRSFFVSKRLDKPLQVVHKQLDFPVRELSWPELSAAQREEQLAKFISEDRERSFDPYQAPLLRAAICEISPQEHQLICTYHKLILDEESLLLLFKDVFACYAELGGETVSQFSPNHTYRNYLAWLKQQDAAAAESSWRSDFADFIAPTPLAIERSPTQISSRLSNTVEAKLSAAETLALQTWASEQQLSLTTLIAAAWAVLLNRYSSENSVVFGLRVSGRPAQLEAAELMVGRFASLLPVRASIRPEVPAVNWLKEFEASRAAQRDREYVSLLQVRNWIPVPENLPVFESSVSVNTSLQDRLPSGPYAGLNVAGFQIIEGRETPIALKAMFNQELLLQITYDEERFERAMMAAMLDQTQTILRCFLERPGQLLGTLPLLSAATERQLLIDWNGVTDGERYDRCLHEMFEAQVERTPDTLAVSFADQQLSYRELNRRANQLAHHLRALGVDRGVLVGLCVERSPELIIGILAVWKAGGAYIPMDPSYPYERLNAMLTAAQPPVLLCQERLVEELPSYMGQIFLLDEDWPTIAKNSTVNLPTLITSDDLAYVIYTSGSTGEPKGVMVQHRGVCNSESVYARVINLPPGSRMLQLTSIGFDMSVFDIVPALISGLTLCLAPQAPPLGADLFKILRDQKIQLISLPPSVLSTVPSTDLPDLTFIGVAGEAVSSEEVARWSPGRRFYNAYGPAEGSIWASGAFIDATKPPFIGRPIENIKLYLVDSQLRLVPVGVPGELCIGGMGVTWGYLRQPDVTADKYVPDPFSGEPGARLYRTGDLARFLPDGNLMFVGRTDSQVKIRGFRIELGEVETVLRRHPSVRDVVVVVRQDIPGDNRLIAYLVLQENETLTSSDLHDYMKKKLPENMVPSAFVMLDALPLSPNGKVDRRALPAPDSSRPELHESFVEPRTPIEEALVDIWAEVLNLDKVGVNDNFFELGGHSLLATQVVSRVRNLFQIDLSLPAVFKAPTIVGIANLIEKALTDEAPAAQKPIAPVSREARRMSRVTVDAS